MMPDFLCVCWISVTGFLIVNSVYHLLHMHSKGCSLSGQDTLSIVSHYEIRFKI